VKAINNAVKQTDELHQKLTSYQQQIREMVQSYPGVKINSPKDAAPQIINIGFPGVKGEVLVNAFSKQDIMVSTTSACSSKRGKLNEVLLAMGISEKQIEGSIRISMGQMTTQKDIDSFKEKFEMIYEEVKELLK
ncbi:aminotransferase class V-fold PLP-dependent enzyme, partial [Bacillaceae bacterium HSR45]|nr:aminotransferase class V-fold PLP-dependent enzyme [Bacillaceae bacterium HSR45]